MATSFAGRSSSKSLLSDSGCKNHMTHDEQIFKELERSAISYVIIVNGNHLLTTWKGTVAVESYSSTKLMSYLLFYPNLIKVWSTLGNIWKMVPILHLRIRSLWSLIQRANKFVKLKWEERFSIDPIEEKFSVDPIEEKLAAYPIQEMTTNIWHKRLRHFHQMALLYMLKKGMVWGPPLIEDGHLNCNICQSKSKVGFLFPRQPRDHQWSFN